MKKFLLVLLTITGLLFSQDVEEKKKKITTKNIRKILERCSRQSW